MQPLKGLLTTRADAHAQLVITEAPLNLEVSVITLKTVVHKEATGR